ncbi:MAG TPA: DNA-binding response regulator [Oxalobacteraceae bacterium]|nr:DNA-binding response regulator [Oxalobacteraceae bacterium]
MTRQVLIVEDQSDIRNLIALHLRDMDCEVTMAEEGTRGLAYAQSASYDLIVLDWMLPGMSGIDICRKIRQQHKDTPIMMLTAKTAENDRVMGLDAGADDYVAKPFSVPEFLARVRVIFRRSEARQEASDAESMNRIVRLKDLVIDVSQRQVYLCTKPVELTAKEFDLLCYLGSHPGRVFTRQQLLNAVWGDGFEGYEHTVNSHMNRLRAKIESNQGEPQYLVTVWGVGYKMADFPTH